jgi:hypothetical protein
MKVKITEEFDQGKYVQQYIKDNIRQIRLTLNQKTEQDLIDWLDQQPNKQGYLKQLIRDDMMQRPS